MKKDIKFIIILLLNLFVTVNVASQRYYWVGKGNQTSWGDIMNWSHTSGGAGGNAGGITDVPTNINTVVFDLNSTFLASRVIVISGAVQCDSLIVESNCPQAPVFNMGNNTSNTIVINGSLIFRRTGVTFSNIVTTQSADMLRFSGSRAGETIQTNGAVVGSTESFYNMYGGSAGVTFTGSGSWLLADDLNLGGELRIQGGTLNLNGKNATVKAMNITGGKMIFPNSTITCAYSWNCSGGTTMTLTETTGSLIRIGSENFTTRTTDRYYNVEFFGCYYNHLMQYGTYNKITFLNGNGNLGNTSSQLVTDSLVIATTNHYGFQRVTINKYFEAKPPVCGGQVRLHGNSASQTLASPLWAAAPFNSHPTCASPPGGAL